tara:strand:+ start:77 stop:688 length:612 start_codon:yes stop_codon:yes gene_type:complete
VTAAIWTLTYEIAPDNRARYLDWFHDIHIPEKLSRAGYRWAGHYQSTDSDRYVAFFGGDSTRVFFDPSPAQLKQSQDDLTREMIALRQNPSSYVFTEEWDCVGPDIEDRPGAAIELLTGAAEEDDAFNAWLAQEMMQVFCNSEGAIRARKLLATLGPAKHGVLYQFSDSQALGAFNSALPPSPNFKPENGARFTGHRLWPPVP